jgi:uncharacterized membrane protein YhiD involved in acid resistance
MKSLIIALSTLATVAMANEAVKTVVETAKEVKTEVKADTTKTVTAKAEKISKKINMKKANTVETAKNAVSTTEANVNAVTAPAVEAKKN